MTTANKTIKINDVEAAKKLVCAAAVSYTHLYKDAIELVTKGASQVCLSVEQETVTCTSRNVVARIEGTDKAEEMADVVKSPYSL